MILRKRFLLLVAWVVLAGPCLAETDRYQPAPPANLNAPWCEGDFLLSPGPEVFGADGGVVAVGDLFFRACQGAPTSSGPETRYMRLFFNPRRVEGLLFDRSLVALIISADTWQRKQDTLLNLHEKVGTRTFGGLTYETFQFHIPKSGTRGQVKSYRFLPEMSSSDPHVPPHLVRCSRPADIDQKTSIRCSVIIEYREITASLLLIGGGPDFPPLPIEKFPLFAQDMLRILQAADITHEYE